MSLFDWFSSTPKSVGDDLLTAYFNEASKFPEFAYPSYDAWMAFLLSKVPDYVELIGELVLNNEASTSVDQARDRMVQLANESGGQASIPQIVQAAGGRGDTINWMSAVPEIASNTAIDLAETAGEIVQGVGTGILSTAKLAKYLPWILGGAAALYIAVVAKGHSKVIK